MTMYSLPNFCRVCLKYDKNLIDLAHIENEPSETLMSKLEQCVSEVDWTAYKPLLCHPCIKRLNLAFSFKKQCVQSANVLRSYLELVKETQKKNESQNVSTSDSPSSPGAFMVLPNQKFVKIVVGPQQQNSFQNVFLNLIPTAGGMNPPALAPVTVNTVSPPAPPLKDHLNTNKDTNQNVFVNLNNTMQKFIPIAPNKLVVKPPSNNTPVINQLLTDTKTEELSVEIDPTIYSLGSDSDSSVQEEEVNDWDELITQSQINSKEVTKMNGDKGKSSKKGNFYGNYVPILPKHAADFLNSGQHFLSADVSFEEETFTCETCQKNFATVKILKHHIKMFHMGKYPFKCEFCYAEYVTRVDYEMCLKSHRTSNESNDDSLTLKDFANTSISLQQSTANQSASDGESNCPPVPGEEGMIFSCELCKRQFNSSTGLLRHKVRKHHQKNKKKYFIKGMKNAKCDICNREFSTQSYMQLHRKLHMREDVGYKYKVFGKSKYSDADDKEKTKKQKDDVELSTESSKNDEGDAETIDVTPDITLEREMDEDSEPELDSPKAKKKCYSRVKESTPDVEVTKVVTVKEESTEDSDDNALQMDLDECSNVPSETKQETQNENELKVEKSTS